MVDVAGFREEKIHPYFHTIQDRTHTTEQTKCTSFSVTQFAVFLLGQFSSSDC